MNIPIARPFFDEQEKNAVTIPLETGWVVQGPKVQEFEQSVAKYTGAGFACATTSCTTALHLALRACGIGPGDEVIVPAFTFIASANAIEYTGAKPVFVDIDLQTYNIDTTQLDKAITRQTKAIMPVHLFGLCANMEPVLALAKAHNLKVIEDAACGMGGFYNKKHAGTMGDAGCLSFHPRKSITTGEGGMVLTSLPEIAQQVQIMRDHGAEISDLQRHKDPTAVLLPEYNCLGYNYRMTDIQGALGIEQMKKLPLIMEKKCILVDRYNQRLSKFDWLIPPCVPEGYIHGYQSYVCLFTPRPVSKNISPGQLKILHTKRNQLMVYLGQKGIATRQGTYAVHALGYYQNKYKLKPWDYPDVWIADQLTLALPLYPQMTVEEQDYVVESLKSFESYLKVI